MKSFSTLSLKVTRTIRINSIYARDFYVFPNPLSRAFVVMYYSILLVRRPTVLVHARVRIWVFCVPHEISPGGVSVENFYGNTLLDLYDPNGSFPRLSADGPPAPRQQNRNEN